MLDQILNLVKGQISESLGGMSGIPADKKAAVVETTADSLMSGLKNSSSPSALSGGVVKALTSKVGLPPQIASTIASTVIPAVMPLLKGKLGGGSGGALGGLGGMLGGLFGKK